MILTNFRRNFSQLHFNFERSFLNMYRKIPVNFGFNGLGDLVYRRTYSRVKDNKTNQNEKWYETVQRVVEGTFNMLYTHCDHSSIKISQEQQEEYQKSAKIMYDKIFNFKFLPPGRGLWTQGSPVVMQKKLYATLNNCAFVSTKPIKKNDIEDVINRYAFLMECSMLGVGVGFDTKGSESEIMIYLPKFETSKVYMVEDSREGWVQSLKDLLRTFLKPNQPFPQFDYSYIRQAGTPLKMFGGVCPGSGPLKELHKSLLTLFLKNTGKKFDTRIIVDIMNFIGKTVVSGNISKYFYSNYFRANRRNCFGRTRRSSLYRS